MKRKNQLPTYLKKWRSDMGDKRSLTQQQAADVFGVSLRTWKRLESGLMEPKKWLIPALEWMRENKS